MILICTDKVNSCVVFLSMHVVISQWFWWFIKLFDVKEWMNTGIMPLLTGPLIEEMLLYQFTYDFSLIRRVHKLHGYLVIIPAIWSPSYKALKLLRMSTLVHRQIAVSKAGSWLSASPHHLRGECRGTHEHERRPAQSQPVLQGRCLPHRRGCVWFWWLLCRHWWECLLLYIH